MGNNQNRMVMVGGIIAAVLLIGACFLGIVGFIYRDSLLALLGLAPRQGVAQMLPAETQFYMVTNPNIQNLSGYQNIKKLYLDNPDIQAIIDEVEAETEGDITFEEDIQPWLGGEIGMAMLDLGNLEASGRDTPKLVVAAETTDTAASDSFIAQLLAEAEENDTPYTAEEYAGVTLNLQENEFSDETTYLTSFNDFVVIATDEALVKEMIDRSQGNNDEPSLVDSDRFQKVTNQLPAEGAMTMYMSLADVFEQALTNSPVELPAEQTQDLEAFEAFGLAGTFQSDGLQLDMVMSYDIEQLSEQTQQAFRQPPSPNEILDNVPADALFVYNFNNLNNIWQQAKKGFESNPDFSQTLADFEQEVGINIDEDVFGWMNGEAALVLVEVTPSSPFAPPLGGYALIGTDDAANAQDKVESVMGVFQEQGMLPPLEPETIGGVEMNVLTDFEGAIQGGYGFHDDYFLVAYLEEAVMAATSASANPLSNSAKFQAVQSRLPDTNYGYMYLDIEHGRQLVESQLADFDREEYDKNVRPFFAPIRAMGVSASNAGVEEGLTKGAFFILITEGE